MSVQYFIQCLLFKAIQGDNISMANLCNFFLDGYWPHRKLIYTMRTAFSCSLSSYKPKNSKINIARESSILSSLFTLFPKAGPRLQCLQIDGVYTIHRKAILHRALRLCATMNRGGQIAILVFTFITNCHFSVTFSQFAF